MGEINLHEEIEVGKVVFTPEIKEEALYEFFDKVIKRATHFSTKHPSIRQYEIDCGNLGLSKTELQKVFDSYVKKRTRETNYTVKGTLASTLIAASSLPISDYIRETLGEGALQDPMYLVPLLLLFLGLGTLAGGILADYFHNRKVKKLRKLLEKIYIKE
jgi:hypothetical protein